MRASGLRLQLLLLLAGLLVVTFVPLYLALVVYTDVTLRRLDEAHARELARTLSAYVGQAAQSLDAAQLARAVAALGRAWGVAAARIPAGDEPVHEFGDRAELAAL